MPSTFGIEMSSSLAAEIALGLQSCSKLQ